MIFEGGGNMDCNLPPPLFGVRWPVELEHLEGEQVGEWDDDPPRKTSLVVSVVVIAILAALAWFSIMGIGVLILWLL